MVNYIKMKIQNTLFYTIFLMMLCMSSTVIAQKKSIELKDIWGSPTFFAKGVYGLQAMNHPQHFSNTAENMDGITCLIKYDYKSGKALDTILNAYNLKVGDKTIEFEDYSFSADERYILLSTESEKIYRHSSKSLYYLYDTKSKSLTLITKNGKVQYASISPANDYIAYVMDNNLFLHNIAQGSAIGMTADGSKNVIINGATDWVYEEEFSMDVAYQWSPDGKYLAYYRFNESEVPEFSMTVYGDLYPKEERWKYPKAGEKNSVVDIFILNMTDGQVVQCDIGKDVEQYIPRIKWTQQEGKLCITRLNRHQNKLELLIADAANGSTRVLLTELSKTFIEISDDLHFTSDQKHFVWTSQSSGFNHIYVYDMDGNKLKQITKGEYDISVFYGYDEKTQTYYYQSTEKNPESRLVYAYSEKKGKRILGHTDGTNTATFSSGFKYMVSTHHGIDRPYLCEVYETGNGKKVRILESNEKVKKSMDEYQLNPVDFFTFKTQAGHDLHAYMIKPADFVAAKKYPVLLYVYGGPGSLDNSSQTVTDEWIGPNYFWFQMLTQKGYIVISVDNRGTPGRGRDFAHSTYMQLGKYEVEDQIETAKYLASLPFVDKDRIGVFGWSYGGYMASALLTKGADYFKTGIAVAPVTNWRYYDTIYTERYMRTPQENASGYDDNSPINHVDKLKGNFLLVHGTADDNVHFQNSVDFVTALTKAGKQFDSFYYPNKAHGISGVRLHLYTMMTNYVLEKL